MCLVCLPFVLIIIILRVLINHPNPYHHFGEVSEGDTYVVASPPRIQHYFDDHDSYRVQRTPGNGCLDRTTHYRARKMIRRKATTARSFSASGKQNQYCRRLLEVQGTRRHSQLWNPTQIAKRVLRHDTEAVKTLRTNGGRRVG